MDEYVFHAFQMPVVLVVTHVWRRRLFLTWRTSYKHWTIVRPFPSLEICFFYLWVFGNGSIVILISLPFTDWWKDCWKGNTVVNRNFRVITNFSMPLFHLDIRVVQIFKHLSGNLRFLKRQLRILDFIINL
jgi:hypothetical protein